MMENNVVTLETAKKLKAAGFTFDDEPVFGWQNYEATWIVLPWSEVDEDMEWYIAPTAQEIADQLPYKHNDEFLTMSKGTHRYVAYYGTRGSEPAPDMMAGDTIVEALATLWLLQEAK